MHGTAIAKALDEAKIAALTGDQGTRSITQRLGSASTTESNMSILWTILIGFVAGVLAKLITPGRNEPQGFILTTILGIIGAVVATYLGQAVGWYRADEGAGLIGATVGAIIVLLVWAAVSRSRTVA
jgi:uncharacterized membrane protein YeaQ/YmgE (transglycosylase-associated protein family)